MQTLTVDFITSLHGYGAAEGWPGWWGLEYVPTVLSGPLTGQATTPGEG